MKQNFSIYFTHKLPEHNCILFIYDIRNSLRNLRNLYRNPQPQDPEVEEVAVKMNWMRE
jgi:hypothetical protein